MPTDLRPDGDDVRTRGLHDRQRGEEPHALEQQGLRTHQRGLRALRDLLEGLQERRREEGAVQAPEEVLRDVRGLQAEDMPGARPRPVRVQRMRQADDLPAPQALLRRRRRAGQLQGDPHGVAQGDAGHRRGARRHERGPACASEAGEAVHRDGHGRREGEVPRLQRAHSVQARELGAPLRREVRPRPGVLKEAEAGQVRPHGDEDRREVPRRAHLRGLPRVPGAQLRSPGGRAGHGHRSHRREGAVHADVLVRPHARVPQGRKDLADVHEDIQYAPERSSSTASTRSTTRRSSREGHTSSSATRTTRSRSPTSSATTRSCAGCSPRARPSTC